MQHQGRVAIITGAGTGVGRAAALALADEGTRVALVGRREEPLRETAGLIEQAGGAAAVFTGDVSEAGFADTLRPAVESKLGSAAILINNAGVHGEFTSIRESDPEVWRRTLLINAYGPYLMARAFMGPMIEAGWGRIVNVSSAASIGKPGGLNSIYPLTKVALNHFTRQLAAELAGTGVTANAIHPGEVKTEMWAAIRDDAAGRGAECEGARQWADTVGRTGGDDPAKAAALIVRICAESDDPPTDQFLWIEGGLTPPRPVW